MRVLVKNLVAGALMLTLAAGGPAVAQMTKTPAEVQAGTYKLDPGHGKVTWSLSHMGFSRFVGQFTNIQGELSLDPSNPATSTLKVTIPLNDVLTGIPALDTHIKSAEIFDTAKFPAATFVSRTVTVSASDPKKATVAGDLTLHGVTKPVTLDVTFNQAGTAMGAYKAGFDATTVIKRSEFGITFLVPALGDDVTLQIEGEFLKQK